MLARAVSDMSQSLRHRIDNIEAFAADVTHELKNPLASLRSAVDSLDRIEDPALRKQLLDVVRQDVRPARPADRRHQRSRADRRRTGPRAVRAGRPWRADRADRVELGSSAARPATCGSPSPARAAPARSCLASRSGWRARSTISSTMRSASRPPSGLVEIAATHVGDEIRIRIDDEGPGVPADQREAIFNRFHSVRPAAETSAAIRDLAWPSPARSSKAMTGRLT